MDVLKLACPTCGAPIAVSSGIESLRCAHCGNALIVQQGEDHAALKVAEQVKQTIEKTAQDSQEVIREGTKVTQAELQRLQRKQDLSMAQLRLSNLRAEMRSLRLAYPKPPRQVKVQLRTLRDQEQTLLKQINFLQDALKPKKPETELGKVSTSTAIASSCLLSTLTFFGLLLLASFGLSVFQVDQPLVGLVAVAMVIVVPIFVYMNVFRRLRT